MLPRTLRAAIVQMTSTPDMETSVADATRLVSLAVDLGADFVALPENAPGLGPDADRHRMAEPLDGPTVSHFQELARDHGVVLLVGSVAEIATPQHSYNTSVLIGVDGEILSTYRKIHLFDVETPSGQIIRESEAVTPGDRPVVTQVGPWRVGLSVCYDLRFPELYRALVDDGATLLCIPAAFTAETGRAHWLALTRARAIESLAYIVAPNQYGRHFGARRSYGRSAIIDPWGTTLAICPDRESVALATLDLDALEKTRRHFPVLQHRRHDLLGT